MSERSETTGWHGADGEATRVLGGHASASDDGATVVMSSLVAPAANAMFPSALEQGTLGSGTRLGEFEITALIGQGGFGAVYEAWDHVLERTVAIKEYLPSALSFRQSDGSVAPVSERQRDTFELGMRSFINEARLLAQFDHPSLLKVYRFWEERGTTYMVMPLYRGKTLRETLTAKRDGVSEAWLLQMVDGVTQALAVMHNADCFHRDIAPDNIMLLEGSEHPVVLDLGAARRVISDKTQAITVILKPGFAPVEQYAEMPDVKQGPWTDVYALAAVLHVAVCGKSPPPSVARVISDGYLPLASNEVLRQRFSPQFLQAIDAGLAVRPEHRPQSMAEFRALLGLNAPGLFASAAAGAAAVGGAGSVAREDEGGGAGAGALGGASGSGRTGGDGERAFSAHASSSNARVYSYKWLFISGSCVVLIAALVWWFTREPAQVSDGAGVSRATMGGQADASASHAAAGNVGLGGEATALTSAPLPPTQPPAPPSQPVPVTPLESLKALSTHASASFGVSARALKSKLQVGKDPLAFEVSSQRAGYVYVYLLTSGNDMLMLFPNQLDRHNHIEPGERWELPRASWPMTAGGPAGVNEFAVVVSEHKRDFSETGAQSDGVFSQFSTSVLAALEQARAGEHSPLLGKAVCDTGSSCSHEYGVAFFSVTEE